MDDGDDNWDVDFDALDKLVEQHNAAKASAPTSSCNPEPRCPLQQLHGEEWQTKGRAAGYKVGGAGHQDSAPSRGLPQPAPASNWKPGAGGGQQPWRQRELGKESRRLWRKGEQFEGHGVRQATMEQLWGAGNGGGVTECVVGNSHVMMGAGGDPWDDDGGGGVWGSITNGYGGRTEEENEGWGGDSGGETGGRPGPALGGIHWAEEEAGGNEDDEEGDDGGGEIEEPVLLTCRGTTPGIKINSDKAAHWVYPSHVPHRDYQGKIVFVAPTKPLVEQQIEACRQKTGLPALVTQELTGNVKTEERGILWEDKRVFYCTPATLNNDLAKGVCPMEKIVCLVVDECHRATGNHPTVQAIRQLRDAGIKFRVLGLSATPGSKFEAVQEVINNLMISKIEFRGEDDPDVSCHSFKRQVDVRVVSTGDNRELQYCRATLLDVQRSLLRRLIKFGVFYNCAADAVQRFSLVQAQARYRQNPAIASGPSNEIYLCFQQAIFLASAFEQMEKYGLGQTHDFVEREIAKPQLQKLLGANILFKEFRQRLGSLVQEGGQHPKMAMLQTVVRQHFEASKAEGGRPSATPGRVIIFTNLRESVHDIVAALGRQGGLIAARAFVGQGGGGGGGMKQKDQKQVLNDFRNGAFNTLVATCIGEEGLDIPAVDLIICFDGAASPTRNIQRMGRTGRHKEGRVVYILAEGKEEADYNRNQEVTQQLHKHLRSGGGRFELFKHSPRMVPRAFNPKMLEVDLSPHDSQVPLAEAPSRRGRGRARARGRRGQGGRSLPPPGRRTGPADSDDRSAGGRKEHRPRNGGGFQGGHRAPRKEAVVLSSDDDGEAEGQDKGGSEEGRDVRRGSNRGGGGGGTTEPSNSLSGDIADDMLVVESTQEDEDYSWSRVPVQLSMMPPPSPPQLLCSTAPAANVSSRETTPNGDNGAIDLTATPSPWGAQENSAQDCRSKVAGSPVEGQRTSEAENPLLDGPVLEATEPPEKGHGAVEMADAAEEVQEADPVELGHSEGEVDTVLEEDWWPVALEDDSLPPGVASYVPGRPSLSDTLREAEARLMIGEGKEGAESAGPRGSRGLLRRLARVLEDSPWALAQAASVAAGGLSEPMGRRGRDERAEGTGGSVEGSGLPCDSPAGGVGPAEDPKILKGGGQPSGDDGPQDLQPESTTPPFEGPSHSPRPPCAGPNPWGPGEGHGEPTVYDPSGTNAISSPQKSICRDLCPEKVWEIPMTQDDVPLAARRVPGGARGAVAMTQDDIPLAERQPHGPKVPWSVRCPKPKARGGQAPRSVETAGPGGTQGSGDMKDDIPLLQRKAMIRCPLRCPTASSLEADTPLSATMKSRGCGGSPLGPSGQAGASIPPGNAGVRDEAAGSRATPHCPSPRGDGSDDTSEDVDVPFIKRCRNFWAPSPPLLGKDIRGQGIGLSLAEMETHGSSPTDPAGGGFQDEDDIPFVKRCKEPRASSAPLHSFVQGSVNGRRYFSKDERKPVGRGSESPTLSQDVDVPLARKTRRRLLPDASPLEDGEAFYPLELPCSGRVMSKQLQSPTERAVALSQEADVLLVERARQLTAGVSPFAGAKEVRPSELQVGAQEAPRGHTCPAERPVDLSQEADIPLAERARHRQWAGVSTTWLATGHVFPLGRAGGAQGSSRRPCSPATGAMNLSQEADMPLAKRARQSLQTGVAWCSRQDSEAPFSSLGPIGAHTVSGGLNSSAEEQRDLSQEADVPLANRVSKLRACEGADSARPAVVSGCAREPTRGLDQPAEGAMGLSRQADIPPAKRMRQPWGDWNSFENREAAHSCEEVVDASQEIGTPLSELSRDLMADGSAEANAEMQDAMHREERLKDLKTAELTRRFWHERAAGPVNLSQKPGSPLSERRKHQREGGTAAGEMGVVFRPSEADTRLNERCRNLCNPNRLAFRPEDVSPSWKERTAWERPTSMARSLEEGNPGDTSRGAPGAMGLPLQLIASPEAKRPKEGTGRLPLEVPPSSPIPSIRDVGAASPDLEGGGGFGAHEETPPVPETPQEVPDTSQESQGMMASALDGPVCLSMPFRQADDHMGAGGGERPPTPPGTLDNGGEGVRQGAFAAPSEVFGDLEHAQDDREDRPSASSPSGSSGCGLMDLWGQGICGLSGGCISQPTQPRPNPDPQPQAMALERDGPCTAPAQDGEDGGRVAFDPEGFALPTPRRPGPRQVCPKSPGLGCTDILRAKPAGQQGGSSGPQPFSKGQQSSWQQSHWTPGRSNATPPSTLTHSCPSPAARHPGHVTPVSASPLEVQLSRRAGYRRAALDEPSQAAGRRCHPGRRRVLLDPESQEEMMPIVMQEEESGEEDAAASGPVASQRNEQPARRRLKRAGEGVGRPHQRWPAEKNAGNRGRTTANRGRNVAARQFFDEEAEVSQEGSGSSDGSDDGTDLDGFIVCTADATPAHSGSRQAGGDTPDSRTGRGDDISMYRRMMLQSATPVNGRGGWHSRLMDRLQWRARSGCTPSPSPCKHGLGGGLWTPASVPSTISSGGASHDDACTVCGEDGELLLCDTCPRAYHLRCVALQDVPSGTWSCQECSQGHQVAGGGVCRAQRLEARFPKESDGMDDEDDEDDLPDFEL